MKRVPRYWLTMLGLIVVILIGVPMIHGVHPTGDLALGDGIVGAGTLLLAVGTAVLASATFQIDKRAAQRETDRLDLEERLRKDRVRSIARLLDAELDVTQPTISKVAELQSWRLGTEVPRSAWDRYSIELLAEVPRVQGPELVKFFSRLDIWTRFVDRYFDRHPDHTSVGVGEARHEIGEISELVELCAAAKAIVNRLAYREVPRA